MEGRRLKITTLTLINRRCSRMLVDGDPKVTTRADPTSEIDRPSVEVVQLPVTDDQLPELTLITPELFSVRERPRVPPLPRLTTAP